MIPEREPGITAERQDDGTSVATLGKPAYVPINTQEES